MTTPRLFPEGLALFGMRLKSRRQALGLKQTHVADRIGITRSQMSNMEAGRSWVGIETLDALCEALSATPNDLLGYGKAKLRTADIARARELGRIDARKEYARKIREALR